MRNFFKKLFSANKPVYQLQDVFTPAKPATYTYIERIDLKNQLESALRIPGKQIVLYGHSGGGKSTLIANSLDIQFSAGIRTGCSPGKTFDMLLKEAFDKLGTYVKSEWKEQEQNKIDGKWENNLGIVKTSVGPSVSQSKEEIYKRIIEIQLTPERLAELLNSTNCVWIIEDFHKVSKPERQKMADQLKLFVDNQAKVILIGAVDKGSSIVKLNHEMQTRVVEIAVPLMLDDELRRIIVAGEKLLNIQISEDLKMNIIRFSMGLPSVCHQLCWNLCETNNVFKTVDQIMEFGVHDFRQVIIKYLNYHSGTLKSFYDRAVRIENNEREEYPTEIIKAMLRIREDDISLNQIHKHLKANAPFSSRKKTEKYLTELTSEERGAFLRFDENSNKYSFTNPFLVTYSYGKLYDELNFEELNEFSELESNKTLLKTIGVSINNPNK